MRTGDRLYSFKRDELLEVLKKNREAHLAIFLEAQQSYREMVIDELDCMLREAIEGKPVRRVVQLAEPMNQTKDYNRVISLFEMQTDDIIQLTEQEFAQYVLDDWHWRGHFIAANAAYSISAASMADD